jgi:hypothetical protein
MHSVSQVGGGRCPYLENLSRWCTTRRRDLGFLFRMVRQCLTIPATCESPERLSRRVGIVKSDFRGSLWTPPWLTWCGLNKHPELERGQEDWHCDWHTHTNSPRHIHTGLLLCHWHTLVIVTDTYDTHQHIDRPPTYRSWLVHLHDLIPCPSLPTINNYW